MDPGRLWNVAKSSLSQDRPETVGDSRQSLTSVWFWEDNFGVTGL